MPYEDAIFDPYDKAENKAKKAYEFYESGKLPQALVEIEDALEINPSNSSWHFNKALTLDSISRFEDAIEEYKIALQFDPIDLEILNSLAVDYTRTGQYDLAIETFESIQQSDPDFESCYCNRIITYTETEQHDLAEQMFYLAQQIEPNCALCYYNIGNSLFIRGEYQKAIGCWFRTAKIEPMHPQINYRIAQAFWSDGDIDKAMEYFLAELRINPGDIDVTLDFGLFLLQCGNIESAKEKFNRILEFNPDEPYALFYLGEIAFNTADYSGAEELFNQAVLRDENLVGPRYRLASCALMRGDNNRAKALLLSEIKLVPEDSDVLTSMGSIFLEIDEIDEAVHCFLRAVDFDCSNAQAYYYLGLSSFLRKQFDDAIQFFNHTLDINPKHISALKDLAITYCQIKEFALAAETIENACSLENNNNELKTIHRKIRLKQKTYRFRKFFVSRNS